MFGGKDKDDDRRGGERVGLDVGDVIDLVSCRQSENHKAGVVSTFLTFRTGVLWHGAVVFQGSWYQISRDSGISLWPKLSWEEKNVILLRTVVSLPGLGLRNSKADFNRRLFLGHNKI